jgi:hypothetical protein
MTKVIDWNAQDITAGTREIRGKWIGTPYLRRGQLSWSALDASFSQEGKTFQTKNCGITIATPSLATQAIEYVNGIAFDCNSRQTIAAPEMSLSVRFPDARPVEGIVLEGRESQVVYPDALGDGIDLAVGIWHRRSPTSEKIIVFRRMPSGDSEFVEVSAEVSVDGGYIPNWDASAPLFLSLYDISILSRGDERRGWTIRTPVAWYYTADGEMKRTPIVARITPISPGKVLITKFVPRDLIREAIDARPGGELRTDLSATFYPDANTETTTHDGYTGRVLQNSTWNALRTGASTITDDVSATILNRVTSGTTTNLWFRIYRMQAGFDLASLSGQTVSAAVFSMKREASTVDSLGLSMAVTPYSPSSWVGVSSGDYAANTSSTRYSSDVAISSTSNNVYSDWSFNSTGISAVQAAVGSRIGLSPRFSNDIDDSAPAWSASISTNYYVFSADTANTTSDPKLVVTYTTGGSNSNMLLIM